MNEWIAQGATRRLKLLKIGALIRITVRPVWVSLAGGWVRLNTGVASGVDGIFDRVTINDAIDPDVYLLVNGLAKFLSTVVLDALTGGKALFLNANREIYSADIDLGGAYITGILPPWKVDLSNYYRRGEVDNLLIGKAPSNHFHAFSVYSNSAGDPAHQHLVQGATGIEQ